MDQITEISQNPKMFKNNVYQKLVEIWSIFYVLVKEDKLQLTFEHYIFIHNLFAAC